MKLLSPLALLTLCSVMAAPLMAAEDAPKIFDVKTFITVSTQVSPIACRRALSNGASFTETAAS